MNLLGFKYLLRANINSKVIFYGRSNNEPLISREESVSK